MAHKIYPHKSQFNFYYELEFIKTAEDFTKEAAKYTNQDAKDQGALVYFKYEGDKLGTILLFDLADKQVSLQASNAAFLFARFYQKAAPLGEMDSTILFKYLSDCVPAFTAMIYEQITEARNKEFFVPQ